MKILIAAIILAISAAAFAGTPQKIGFRAYSSATQTECGVFGSTGTLSRDDNGVAIQTLTPAAGNSRTLLLGTKGFKNYSTNAVRMVTFTCRSYGTSTAASVKVFLNGTETHFLTLSSGTFAIGQ